jgi:glucitol operon activator protein
VSRRWKGDVEEKFVGLWSWILLTLAILWLLQIAGTYYQVSHYRKILGRVASEGGEGYVGVGNAKGRFGKGVILILVSDAEGTITKALKMRGRTVFARFEEARDLVGFHLDELRDEKREGPYDAGTMLATRRAIQQIDKIKAEKEVGAEVG